MSIYRFTISVFQPIEPIRIKLILFSDINENSIGSLLFKLSVIVISLASNVPLVNKFTPLVLATISNSKL